MKNFKVPLFVFMIFIAMSFANAGYVWQENGDSYSCDANVGNPLNFNDSDWSTTAYSLNDVTGYCYVNYTKPTNAVDTSFWKHKDGGNISSSLGSCWNQNPLELRAIMHRDTLNPSFSYIGFQCYNSSSWNTLSSQSTIFSVYEEAMNWSLEANVTGCMDLNVSGTTYKFNSSLNANDRIDCLKVTANDIELDCDGYTLTGNLSTVGSNGIYIDNVNRTKIKNCTIEDFSMGIYFNDGYNHTVTNNIVRDNLKIGIHWNGSYNANISNNEVYNNSWSCSPMPSVSCCGIGGSNNGIITNNRIYDNNNGDGITIYGDNNTIKNNTIYGNSDGIFFFWFSDNNLVDLNNVYDNIGNCVYFYHGQYNNLTNNTFTNCSNAGIYISGSSNPKNYFTKIINNTFDNQYYGIYLYYTNNSLIENNTLINGVQTVYTSLSENNTIRNNNITNFTNQGIHLTAGSLNNLITLNNVSSPTCSYAGIHVNGSSNYNTVSFNNISASGNFGIEITSNNNNNVTDNYVVNTSNNVINTDSADNTLIQNNYVEINSQNMHGIVFVGTTPQFNKATNNIVWSKNTGQIGILSHRCDGCLADSNKIYNISGWGIAFDVETKNSNITYNVIENSTISNSGGIQTYSFGYAPLQNNIIYGNNITGMGAMGIHINTANGTIVQYNIIKDESAGNDSHAILNSNSNNSFIYKNNIRNYEFGIDVRGTSDPNAIVSFDNVVQENYVETNYENVGLGEYGIGVCCGASRTIIKDNTVLNTLIGVNVWWYNTDGTVIDNNNIYGIWGAGIECRGDVSPSMTDRLDNITIKNNRIHDFYNPFTVTGYSGMNIYNVTNSLIFNNTIESLHTNNTQSMGIHINQFCDNIDISYNNIRNLTYYCPAMDCFDTSIGLLGTDEINSLNIHHNTIGTIGLKDVLGISMQFSKGSNNNIHDNNVYTKLLGIDSIFSCASGCINNTIHNNYIHGQTETPLASAVALTGTYSPLEVYNNWIYDALIGLRVGYVSLLVAPVSNVTSHDNTIWNNQIGIFVNSGSTDNTFTQDLISNNTNADIMVLSGSNNTFDRVQIGSGTIATIDNIIGNNFTVKAVQVADRPDLPPAPPSMRYRALGDYINISKASSTAIVSLRTYYNLGTTGINENSIVMWKWDNVTWTDLHGNLNMTDNYIEVTNITDFSIFVTAGQQPMTQIIVEAGANALSEMLEWLPIILPILILSFLIGAFLFGRFDVDTLVTGIFILIVVTLALVLGALILTKMGTGG